MKRVMILLLLVVSTLWGGLLPAQTIITGSVTGTVTDPSGSVVVGAPIVLTNIDTGSVHQTKTNSSGLYRFDLLVPGNYKLTINQPGFAKLESPVTISNDQIAGANLKLAVAGSNQTVDVTAQSPLQVEDGNVATTVTQTQIEEIPNSGNNMSYVTRLVPGYGGAGTTLYTVDGMLNNDTYGNSGDTGANNLMLGLSEVKEATVSLSAYSGQYGGLVGAQVNFVTKGGTNRVHGTANYWWTGRSLYANNWFNNLHGTPRPSVNANQWSADIGFPVFKNRLFLYTDTEGLRLIIPPATTGTQIPSPAFQAATLTNLASKGLTNSIPFYKQLFALYNGAPGASRAVPGNGTNSTTGCPSTATGAPAQEIAEFAGLPNCTLFFQGGSQTFSNEWLVNVRGDFVISSKDSGFARVGADLGLQPSTTSQINPLFNTVSWQPLHSGQLNETHLFGNRAISSFLVTGYWYISLFGPQNVAATLAAFPASISLADGIFTGTGASSTSGRIPASGQVQDDISLFLGKHTLKFGGRLYVTKISDYSFGSGKVPTLSAATLGAFYGGGTDTTYAVKGANPVSSISQSFSAYNSYPTSYHQLGLYVEDDWQIRPNLTLTGSLRVDEQSNIRCLKNCITRTTQPFPSLQQAVGVPYNQALLFNQQDALPGISGVNWEPRIGFAYTPPVLNRSLVIRGGVGVFADRLPGSIADSVSANPPNHPSFKVSGNNLANTETSNLFDDATAFNAAFATGITTGTLASIKSSLTPTQLATFSPPALYSTQNNLKIFELYKWNLEVQKSLPKDIVVSLNYLGQRGNHNRFTNPGLNAWSTTVGGLPTSAPDPRFGAVTYLFSGGNSAYQAAVASFTKRFRNAGNFTAGYTYSKAWDTNSIIDPYHPLSNWGPTSDGQILTINYVYKLPFKSIIYGGWEFAGTAYATSGTQFSVTDPATTTTISGSTGSTGGNYGGSLLAVYLGGGEASCSNPHSTCLLKSEFASATSVAKAQTRPLFRGPDYIDTDLSLTKTIPLHWEGGKFSVGVQAYNILNHPNFSTPSATLNSSTFGLITSTKNSSGIFSGVGGDDSPRILQIKGKVSF